ncbi:DUF4355 domain-containing protein [Carnobacterium maltaromaticum]|uniref:capsid assembly scaffolding protein Gp46 family protein n=1 Tax=Carnobacterium maltaromaticum TaxID=2751 RepID=UPI0039AFBB40
MPEFKAINTQEEFDEAVKNRVKREQETIEKKYADYEQLKTRNTELEEKVAKSDESSKAHEITVADLNAKISDYETASLRTKIAVQNGLPLDLAERLVGTDEASIKADAERLAGFVVKQATPPPLKDTETLLGESKDGAYKNLIENLNIEGE